MVGAGAGSAQKIDRLHNNVRGTIKSQQIDHLEFRGMNLTKDEWEILCWGHSVFIHLFIRFFVHSFGRSFFHSGHDKK
jgi:hypothetical protein